MENLKTMAADQIRRGEYDEAMQTVSAGTCDLMVLALLAVASELQCVTNALQSD